MKILVSGKSNKPRTHTTVCICGCMYTFEASEAVLLCEPHPRAGRAYLVKCPECPAETYVDTAFFK
jgi:hypothetical protein